jgi:two-component system copper resistance phosphate regulon response regulator CusR
VALQLYFSYHVQYKSMRILVVEDEHKIANAIKQGLTQQSYAVDVAYDGDVGLAMATTETYDLIILDRMMPGSVDGMGILKALRDDKNHVPVLLLTAKDKVLDKAHGLNSGADDYLVKPFAFVELIARVRALLRRPQQAMDSKFEYNDVVLDTENMLAERAGSSIELTAKEFALLEYFMRNPERVISKDALINHVWSYDADVLPNTVEVYVGYLRAKLDKPFLNSNPLIHTRRGFGYFFGVKK